MVHPLCQNRGRVCFRKGYSHEGHTGVFFPGRALSCPSWRLRVQGQLPRDAGLRHSPSLVRLSLLPGKAALLPRTLLTRHLLKRIFCWKLPVAFYWSGQPGGRCRVRKASVPMPEAVILPGPRRSPGPSTSPLGKLCDPAQPRPAQALSCSSTLATLYTTCHTCKQVLGL